MDHFSFMILCRTSSPGFPGSPGGPGVPGKPLKRSNQVQNVGIIASVIKVSNNIMLHLKTMQSLWPLLSSFS